MFASVRLLAWQRLVNTLFGIQTFMLDRAQQWAGWRQQLRGNVATAEKLSGEDIGPLAVAFAVEVGLTLLFLFRSGTLPNHPGLAELQKLVSRGRDQVFDTVWVALGGDEARGAVRRVLSRFTKFEGKSTLVVVPVYSKDPAIQLLHQLMHVLIHLELAKFVYTGEYLRPIFGLGWTKSHRADALNHGAVRVYRMSAADYLALILDAMQGTGHDQVSTTTGGSHRARFESFSSTGRKTSSGALTSRTTTSVKRRTFRSLSSINVDRITDKWRRS